MFISVLGGIRDEAKKIYKKNTTEKKKWEKYEKQKMTQEGGNGTNKEKEEAMEQVK